MLLLRPVPFISLFLCLFFLFFASLSHCRCDTDMCLPVRDRLSLPLSVFH